MNEQEAKLRLQEYLTALRATQAEHVPDRWWEGATVFRDLGDGSWVAEEERPPQPGRGVLVRPDGTCIPFRGALGKWVPTLGNPIAREYFLGSAELGRYQLYEKGLAIWEKFGEKDLGYPTERWPSPEYRARSCRALIAFFDLRGFTNWSAEKGRKPSEVQDTIERFEHAFQDAFSRVWCQRLFAKGTGDGLMVVSEAGCYGTDARPAGRGEFQHGHARAFCLACAQTLASAEAAIPAQLAIGCGVTIGEITQLYLLGRFDYIGPAVNEASKIQAIAYGELCLSNDADHQLRRDGVEIGMRKVIPTKGIRVGVADVIAACSTK